ncbi:MAG: GNAT family N-acyltransferase, partial [Methylococcales bacterium]
MKNDTAAHSIKSGSTESKPSAPRCVILAPCAHLARQFFPQTEIDHDLHGRYLAELRTLRTDVYVREGFVEQHEGEDEYDALDAQAWHIALYDETQQRWIGCVRMMAFHLKTERLDAHAVMNLGKLRVEDPVQESALLAAIDQVLDNCRERGGILCYLGGLAIAVDMQNHLYPVRLAIFCHVWYSKFAASEALTFADIAGGAAELNQVFGFDYLVTAMGSFYCQEHKSEFLPMRWNPAKVRPGIA